MGEIIAPMRVSLIPRARWAELGLGSTAVVASIVAAVACSRVSIPVESDYGLVTAMPLAFWCAVGALTISMLVALNRDPITWQLLGLLQVCLCVAVYSAPSLMTDVPRTEVAWRHLGITETLIGSGQVNSDIDAYFSWPGFFAGLGAVLDISGVDPQSLALWAPLINGLLWLGAVAIVVRALTDDKRHQWLAMWLFTLTNWIDQDYLSPQATAFFLYLVVIALLLTVLAADPSRSLRAELRKNGVAKGALIWWSSRRPSEASRRLRVAGLFLVVLLSMVIIASHQLTPFVLIAAVFLLTLAGRSWAPGLFPVIGLGLVLWLISAASSYLTGHPVLGLDVGGSAAANVGDRMQGSPGHMAVVHVRTLFTAGCWLLAALGIVRLARRRSLDRRALLLFLVPFLLVPANSYGGEMMLRAALFASPFTAYLAAGALLPRRRLHHRTGIVALAALLTAASVAMFTARYGNARFDMFTQNEVDGSRALYSLAPPGAVLIAAAHPTPWRFDSNYGDFRHSILTDLCPAGERLTNCAPKIVSVADRGNAGVMLLVNRAHLASMDMQANHSAAEMAALERLMTSSGDAVLVYQNPDVNIYEIKPQEGR